MSSTETNSANADSTRRQQIIAIAMLVIFVGGAVGFGFWQWQSNRSPDEPLMDPPMGRGMGGGNFARMPEPQRDGVRKTGTSFTIRSGQAVMVALPSEGNWRFSYRYQPGKFSSPDQPSFLTAKYQSMALGLSDEQKKQLNALPAFVGGMIVSPDDQKKLEGLWKDYNTASDGDKPKREQVLVDELKNVAERSVQPTLAAVDEYVGKIKAVLTPEQVGKLQKK
ncbi:MAG: hypothetical protein H7Z14_08720 [Anaerolineae bacterium]|nr:hypothetical protein [Phycisphaerae bacterium]